MSLREILLHLTDASNIILVLVIARSDLSMGKCGKHHFSLVPFQKAQLFLYNPSQDIL